LKSSQQFGYTPIVVNQSNKGSKQSTSGNYKLPKPPISSEEKDLIQAKAQLTRAQTFEIYRKAYPHH
jgi:hypothetical protein